MALLSKTCVYGLRAMIRLAAHSATSEHPLPIRSIADELGIPFHFLTKILQKLTQAGVLESTRGAAGGVRLTRPAASIRLVELVLPLDDEHLLEGCVLGLGGCGEKKPCPLHAAWTVERRRLKTLFEETRLDTLAARLDDGTIRLSDRPDRPGTSSAGAA